MNGCKKDDPKIHTTMTDHEGNVYNVIVIGTQTWMAENLKTTKYRNGDLIGTTLLDISNESNPKYQWAYGDNENNVAIYGRLYSWGAVIDNRNICPAGWHIPTDAEWTSLTNYLGGENVAGAKLKETGTSHWVSPNPDVTNESGFTALPGGIRFSTGFDGIGYFGFWWSTTPSNTISTWHRFLGSSGKKIGRNAYDNVNGFSVRCIKD